MFIPGGIGCSGIRFSTTNHGIANASQTADPNPMMSDMPQLLFSLLVLASTLWRMPIIMAIITMPPAPAVHKDTFATWFRSAPSA